MNTENKYDYYEVLELNENATQHEIYTAYTKAKITYSAENTALSKVFSRDEARALRSLIEEAYAVLSNNDYRNIYEKRMLAAKSSEADISVNAIKADYNALFQKAVLPVLNLESTGAPIRNEQFEKEISEKKIWNGQDLKKVREYRKLSFDELTDITKINPWYIAALEEMKSEDLPVDVFVRGYVIQVAKALGLKEKIVADSYMHLFRKKIEN